LAQQNLKIKVINNFLYNYDRTNESSITKTVSRKHLIDLAKSFTFFNNNFKDSKVNHDLKNLYTARYVSYYIYNLRQCNLPITEQQELFTKFYKNCQFTTKMKR